MHWIRMPRAERGTVASCPGKWNRVAAAHVVPAPPPLQGNHPSLWCLGSGRTTRCAGAVSQKGSIMWLSQRPLLSPPLLEEEVRGVLPHGSDVQDQVPSNCCFFFRGAGA